MSILIHDRLLAKLEEVYPDKLPVNPTTIETICREQGRQDVIRFLKSLKEEEDEGVNTIDVWQT